MPNVERHDEAHPDHALMGDGTEWQRRISGDQRSARSRSASDPDVERREWVQETIRRRAARVRAHVGGIQTPAWLRARLTNVPALAVVRERVSRIGTRGRLAITGACVALTLIGLVPVVANGPERSARSEGAAVQSAIVDPAETPTPAIGAPVATYVMIITGTPPTRPPIATPMPPPQVEFTPRPTSTSAVPRAALVATPTAPPPSLLVVVNSDPEGVSIRKEPGAGERMRVWRDGTPMLPLSEERQVDGRSWRKVRDPEGNEGWIAAEFLAESGAGPATSPTPPSPTTTTVPSLTRTPRPSVTPTPTPGLVRPGGPLFGPGSSGTPAPAGTPARGGTPPSLTR